MKHPFTLFKENQKNLALKIRETKNTIKTTTGSTQASAQSKLHYLRWDYRINHIAYCEARGRTRDQIEKTNNLDNWQQRELDKAIADVKFRLLEDVKAYNDKRIEEVNHAVA